MTQPTLDSLRPVSRPLSKIETGTKEQLEKEDSKISVRLGLVSMAVGLVLGMSTLVSAKQCSGDPIEKINLENAAAKLQK